MSTLEIVTIDICKTFDGLKLPHTHTHTCICGLQGLSIGVMVFILYKLYFLSLYTNYTKPTPYRKLLPIFEFHKTPFSMFLNPFGLQVLRGEQDMRRADPFAGLYSETWSETSMGRYTANSHR